MMGHDRLFGLHRLHAYPGSDMLDCTFWLPLETDKPYWTVGPMARRRRIWVLTAARRPSFAVDDVSFRPEPDSRPGCRWVDCGVVEIPLGFTQLRVWGMASGDAAQSFLLISSELDLTLTDEPLELVQERLWGISRRDAGHSVITPVRTEVGRPVTFTATYRAGERGLPVDARIHFSVTGLFDAPQADQPESAGYVRVIRSDIPVAYRPPDTDPGSHERAGFCVKLLGPLPSGGLVEVSYTTTRTYLFPIGLHESDPVYWYSRLAPLAVSVSVGPGRPYVPLLETHHHSVEFVAGDVSRLHLFLPGRCRVGSEVRLQGVWTDRYRNLPSGGRNPPEVVLRLEGPGGVTVLGSSAGGFTGAHTFRMKLPVSLPGIYRVEAVCAGTGRVLARSNPLEVMAAHDRRDPVYWGEIHAHTRMSDGAGEPEALYRHAGKVGCLDFAATADHACYFSDNEWQWIQDVTNACNDPGRLVTLVGYEWAGKQVHRNIYTSRDRLRLFRGMYPATRDLETVWRNFHDDPEVVGGPHGCITHGLDWSRHDPAVERFVEIYSMWGACDDRDNPLIPEYARTKPSGLTVRELLASGARLGFTGGGDCHDGRAGFSGEDVDGQGTRSHTIWKPLWFRCGMTAAVLPELTRKALIQALRERRTYATTGARILLDFSVGTCRMGDDGVVRVAQCKVSVHAVEPLDRVEIIRDGRSIRGVPVEGETRDLTLSWKDPDPAPGNRYYYLHVVQRDGQQAWSSPVWVRVGSSRKVSRKRDRAVPARKRRGAGKGGKAPIANPPRPARRPAVRKRRGR